MIRWHTLDAINENHMKSIRLGLIATLVALVLSVSVQLAWAAATDQSTQGPSPARLKIPAIGVDAAIESVGQTSAGAMDVPRNVKNVAWYNLGAVPGTPGNSVISGHYDDTKGPAVFYKLGKLKAGDRVVVVGGDQVERTFAVISVETHPYNKSPITRIFGFDLETDLNLITCGGRFNKATRNYSQRTVVYTRLVK